MTRLSVNLNKVALLRNQRTIGIPSVVRAARLCVEAGADGLTVHPRPDERHVRPGDVTDLAAAITAWNQAGAAIEFNVEGNPFEGAWLDLVRAVRPAQATLVPDAPGQSTSDHGWEFPRDVARLTPVVGELKALGCRVSLFADADSDTVGHAREAGADRVELYTEPYAAAFARGEPLHELQRFSEAAYAAQEHGLGVNAGHDLNLENLGPFLRRVPGVLEVSIGHALTSDALEMGLSAAVRAYRAVARA